MIKYRDFINEGNIPKPDLYKDMKYNIGDKILFRVRNVANFFKGEIFNRAIQNNNRDIYCIKVDKDKPFCYGLRDGVYNMAEFPEKADPERRAYWINEQDILNIDTDKTETEKIYLKEYFDKYLKKCDNPTQKKIPHTWNCKYCKGTGMRGYEEIFRAVRPLLKDKEIKYQDSYENYFNENTVWFNVDEYWYELDFNDVKSWTSKGRLLVRPKKENDPNDNNWWFMNSEKKSIKK